MVAEDFRRREKSLLRRATKHVLSQSVAERVKSPYPSTQDPNYATELQKQAIQVVEQDGPEVSLFDREFLSEALHREPSDVDPMTRNAVERLLDMNIWFEQHKPTIRL